MALKNKDPQIVVDALKSRIGKNTYTQGPNRTKVGAGFGDCSATMQWCYQKIGINPGSFTGDQIKNGVMVDSGPVMGKKMNINNLKPGDLIFYKGKAPASSFRPYGVGHVEMYIGNGQVCGHGSGKGPTIKNIKTYRPNDYIMAKRLTEKPDLDPVMAITQDMIDNLNLLSTTGIINTPEYWKPRLANTITVGDAFALMKNLHIRFEKTPRLNNIDNYKVNAIQYLADNGLINRPDQWKADINKSVPSWAIMVILANIHLDIKPNSQRYPMPDNFKMESLTYCYKHGIITNSDVWMKKINDPILVWHFMSMVNNLNAELKK